MFQKRDVDKLKHTFMFKTFLPKIVPFMR